MLNLHFFVQIRCNFNAHLSWDLNNLWLVLLRSYDIIKYYYYIIIKNFIMRKKSTNISIIFTFIVYDI